MSESLWHDGWSYSEYCPGVSQCVKYWCCLVGMSGIGVAGLTELVGQLGHTDPVPIHALKVGDYNHGCHQSLGPRKSSSSFLAIWQCARANHFIF